MEYKLAVDLSISCLMLAMYMKNEIACGQSQ